MKCDVCGQHYAEFAMKHAEPERGIPWETCTGCMYAGRVPYHILVTKAANSIPITTEQYELAQWFGKTRAEFAHEVFNYIDRNQEVDDEDFCSG